MREGNTDFSVRFSVVWKMQIFQEILLSRDVGAKVSFKSCIIFISRKAGLICERVLERIGNPSR